MRKRVLVIGIDSMDSELINKFIEDLPNIRQLKESSPDIKLKGVFPPDSPTSWASIYTGLNPGKHGVLFFVDPLEKTSKLLREELDNSTIKGRTFWDLAGKFGRKVYIFWPLLGYPVWEVNGIMVGRATTKDDVQMFPSIEDKRKLLELSGLRGLPGRNPNKFIEKGKNLLKKEAEFALKYLNEEWDLFFFYSSVLDPIQHSFWNYFDKTDPTYPGKNPYERVIPEFYKEYDKVVGRLIRAASSDTIVILLSDHGHMRRPVYVVNINKILAEKKYLSINSSGKSMQTSIYKKRAVFMDFIARYKLGDIAAKLLRRLPKLKSMFIGSNIIDWENTIAYLSDLSGIKAYNYGGIVIRKDKLGNLSYEDVRNDIINILLNLKHPITNEPLMKWAKKREELYNGKFIEKYPDIVFEFHEDYGAGWSFKDSLITTSDSHNIQPGSHRKDTPVLFISNLEDKTPARENATLMDIAPTILDLLGIDWRRFDFDGRSIFQ